jgi:hypothetical protein
MLSAGPENSAIGDLEPKLPITPFFRALQSGKPQRYDCFRFADNSGTEYLTVSYDECYIGNGREPCRAGGLAPVASLFLILMLRGCASHLEEEKCSGYLSVSTFAYLCEIA